MKPLTLYLLGPFHVVRGGEPVTDFRSNKVRALLVYLALEADRPHRREVLAGLLWPEVPDGVARRNLRLSLHRLREALDDRQGESAYFQISRETIRCRPEAVWVDAVAFEALLTASRRHDHRHLTSCAPCMQRFAEAAALYRGDFLAGFFLEDSPAFSEWVGMKREQFHRQALTVLYHLAAYHRRRGELEQAQKYARRQLELEPWREEAHRQLMDILACAGEISAALAQYETCRRILAEELKVEPDEETQRLYRRIQRLRTGRRHNLPPQATPFVGRKAELAQIAALLADPDCRLLVLVGPPGIGKTRLALEAAAAQVNAFLHGVRFVPLDALDAPNMLVPAIAESLGLPLHGGEEPKAQLLRHLRERELLLVMDNFEHLLSPSSPPLAEAGAGRGEEATTLLVEVLENAPEVKLLVTSRERLNLRWEWVFPVEGLEYPDGEVGVLSPSSPSPEETGDARSSMPYAAVQLFLQTARRADAHFSLAAEAPAVVRICQLVEGMPLGIELAAAWVRAFSCREIAAQIQRNLDFLATSLRDVPERHRSLRAAFESSWHLLSEAERRAFRRLSVFQGGFLAEAAGPVAGASRFLLAALVDKSLLRRTPEGRYGMHELLREYAGAKLRESPEEAERTQARHCRYYASFLHQRVKDLKGERQKEALDEIRAEMGNLRAAWHWAVAHGRWQEIGQALEGLYHFYEMQGWFREGEEAFRQAVEGMAERGFWSSDHGGRRETAPSVRNPQAAVVVGKLLARWGWFSWRLGLYGQGRQLLQQGLAVCRNRGERDEVAFCLGSLGFIAHNVGEYEEAERLYRESLALYREVGDRWAILRALDRLGLLSYTVGAYRKARQLFREALALAEEIGERRGVAFSLAYLGLVACELGEYTVAQQRCREGLALLREMGDPYGIALCLAYLGIVLRHLGEFEQAGQSLHESLALFQELGDRHAIAYVLNHLGDVYRGMGQYPMAERLYRESLALYGEVGSHGGMAGALARLGRLAFLRGEYEEAEELLRESLRLVEGGPGDRSKMALIFHWWGEVAGALGEYREAEAHLREALRIALDLGARPRALDALVGFAGLLVETARTEQAVAFLRLAQGHPASCRETRERARRFLQAQQVPGLPAGVVTTAEMEERDRELEEIAEAILTRGESP